MPKRKTSALPATVDNTAALAAYLGLSRWTISRALNGHPGIKLETRDRVFAAMEELGFTPNPMARGLRGSRTGLIGVVFQEIESPILAKKTAILQLMLRRQEYRTLIELNNGRPDLEEECIRHFLALKCDGVVLVGSLLPPDAKILQLIRSRKIPLVVIDPVNELDFPSIQLDRRAAMKMVLELFYRMGHRHFCLLGLHESVPYGTIRRQAFEETARQLGLPFRKHFTLLSLPDQEVLNYAYGEILAGQYLALPHRPSAIIAHNDRIAIGAIKRLREAGLECPRDFSISGFDNLEITQYFQPTLTTIDQQLEAMMGLAVQTLATCLEGAEPVTAVHLLQPLLLVRNSTTAPTALGH